MNLPLIGIHESCCFFTQHDVIIVEFECFLNGFNESEIKKRKALAKVQYLPIIHHH